MAKSMTGFGFGEITTLKSRIKIEIKTYNHRFFEISGRLPDSLSAYEDKIRVEISGKIKRGKANLFVSYDKARKSNPRLVINAKLAGEYKKSLLDLRDSLSLKDEISLSSIIALPNVVTFEEEPKEEADIWPILKIVLDKALDSLIRMRKEEGRLLSVDIIARKNAISRNIALIEKRSGVVLKKYRSALLKKIKEFSSGRAASIGKPRVSSGTSLDKDRIELEVALFAKNSDIAEEITRIKAHLESFEKALLKDEEIGRKLDFIAQELHREINTIGQKTGDYKIAQLAISVKGEIEKIREQIQNIE
ncbi:MAG: YicC/YloC family endoribonuclease [Candidatus Omnitrophota bacterium]